MASQALLYALNRGLISRYGLARVDMERLALSSDVQENFIPLKLGSMTIRPGLQYIGATDGNNAARSIPFVFSRTDHAIIELTSGKMRVWDDDTLLTRVSTSTAVTNGTFGTDLTGWTDNDQAGATSAWKTGGYMSLIGNTTTRAIRTQQVTVGASDQNKRHALDITIEFGPVILRVGSTDGADDYVREVELETGRHSLAFTPTGNFWIQFSSFKLYEVLVDTVAVGAAGDMELVTPWTANDLSKIRYDQSADVIYVACVGYQWRKIIRWDAYSWSVVKYSPTNGPVKAINTGPTTLTASATTGGITLTASQNLFRAGHVDAIFKHIALSQKRTATITAQNTFTSSIIVTGVDTDRIFGVTITGTWSATVTLQYSIGEEGDWIDYDTYTTNQSITVDDKLPNQIVYYRIGVKTGEFTSGSISVALTFAGGTQTGYVKIRTVASATSATAAVLSELGSTDATDNWCAPVWSDDTADGWPSAVALDDGRLWWARNYIAGSVSDDYENFDSDLEGDSAPVIRSIGFGPIDSINWMKSADQLLLGTDSMEVVARSTGDMEPKTVTNFNLKRASTQGSGGVDAIDYDTSVIYIHRNGVSVFELAQADTRSGYSSVDLTTLVPEIGEPGISRIAVQRRPDTRVHFVRDDGKVALMMVDEAENLASWSLVSTDGDIEDVVVLPGEIEDQVYYVVKRIINSATVRFYEKWAIENDCRGGTYVYSGASATLIEDLPYPDGIEVTVRDADGDKIEDLTVSNGTITLSVAATYASISPTIHKLADSFIVYSGPAVTTITGLSHLEGETVVVRGNGKNLGTKTVSSGQITGLSESVEKAVIGLAYTAKWRGTKLSQAPSGSGGAIGKKKDISQLGLLLVDTKHKGITFGPSFSDLQNMGSVVAGATIDDDFVWQDYDADLMPFIRKRGNDLRVCLQAAAPDPCTVLGMVMSLESHGKS